MGMTTLSSIPAYAAPAAPGPLPAGPCQRPGLTIRRGLRVIRRPEDSHSGCLRLAGRLAQVCAELDRLARLESH